MADQSLPDSDILRAIGRYVEAFHNTPTAKGWAGAGLTPSEKTIRRRFGSFRAAVAAAAAEAEAGGHLL